MTLSIYNSNGKAERVSVGPWFEERRNRIVCSMNVVEWMDGQNGMML